MQLSIVATRPYSFAQTVGFLRRFPPCQGDYVVTDHAITAAVSVGGIARAFTLRAGEPLTIDLPRHLSPEAQRAMIGRATDFIGADDDLGPLYAAAADDPPFRAIVDALHGLHHVRFLSLAEISVYCVLMQRMPVQVASAYKRRFLDRFGIPVSVDDAAPADDAPTGDAAPAARRAITLRAMPELDQLVELSAADVGDAIGHARKATRIVDVIRGVAAIGEPFLRTAPYAAARDALLAIPGVGPFSATAILLRGLGRMDELPAMRWFEDEARAVYGRDYDPAAITRRYGAQIGYWSFYLKASASLRSPRGRRPAVSPPGASHDPGSADRATSAMQ